MKILCVIDSLGPGGAQRQLVELAKGFKEKGHEVNFLTYHEINFFRSDLEKAGIPIKLIIEPNYVKRILKIRKAIRKESPDAVLSFLEGANFMATLSGFPFRKWKLVVGERSANPQIFKSKKLIIYRWFHLFTDYVVANSHANLGMVKKINPLLSKRKMKVIYNIVNVPKSNIVNIKKSGKLNITVAASYRSIKNADGLIKAIASLSKYYKESLEIHWFGNADNEYFVQMEKLIKDNRLQSIINLHDKTTEIFDKYQSADFVGLFSHHEGFPNTICEAMAMSKPVIVSRVSDIPLFIKEGQNGFLCDPDNICSMKTAIIKTIKSDTEDRVLMGKNNLQVSNINFKKEDIIQSYLNLLS